LSISQAWRLTNAGLELFLSVTPNANADLIGQVEVRNDGQSYLAVRVRAIPDKGKANKAVITLLAKNLKLPKSSIKVIKGHQARQKCLLLQEGIEEVVDWLKSRN